MTASLGHITVMGSLAFAGRDAPTDRLDPHARVSAAVPAPDWSQAACRGSNQDMWFQDHMYSKLVEDYCDVCPIKEECLDFAMANHEEWGVWGGELMRLHSRARKLDRNRDSNRRARLNGHPRPEPSMVKGVSWNHKGQTWEVRITSEARKQYLGVYKDRGEAEAVALEYRRKAG